MKAGVIYLKIKLELNQDIKEDDIRDFVDNLDYEIKDDKNLIANAEIADYDTSYDF